MIGSMDFVTMAPRSVEAAEMQGRDLAMSQNAENSAATQMQKNTELKNQQTVETQKSETEDLDENGSGNSAYSSNQKNKKKEKENKAPVAPRSNSAFDIMI